MMIEIGLLALATAAASGLVVLARHTRDFALHQAPEQLPGKVPLLIPLAAAGTYQIHPPGAVTAPLRFQELAVAGENLSLRDTITRSTLYFPLAAVQWVSAVGLTPEGLACIRIHLEIEGRWRILGLQIPEPEMARLAVVLRRTVPARRMNLSGTYPEPAGIVSAHLAGQTLQGETTIGQEVDLYLLPPLLVVLCGDQVQAKIDTASIRRVLAVERQQGRLDNLLRGGPEGIVRLYSMSETAAFALSEFHELADEIGYIARCPVEHITREDKLNKA